jgi:hypothetical protein
MAGAYPAAARFAMLVHAASRSDRMEHTAKILKNLPSGHGIRDHLPPWSAITALAAAVNEALVRRMPPRLSKHQQQQPKIAIDLNLIPYYQ